MSNDTEIAASLARIKTEIQQLEQKYARTAGSVSLLAVSKTKPVEAISACIATGHSLFGENYPDEALQKIQQLQEQPCQWHFIGALQSRKCATIAAHFHWVHSVDRLRTAQKLSQHRAATAPALNICLQVNIDNEVSKSGIHPDELDELAAQCHALPNLNLRGLMAIPAPSKQFTEQRHAFARLRTLFESMQANYPTLDTLSMGMSGDMEAAIAEGATIVRVGTAIFGARDTQLKST